MKKNRFRGRDKLTKEERDIERDLEAGLYVPVPKEEFEKIKAAFEARKKDTVLNLRINSYDLSLLKAKAQKGGMKYQTFIAEILHRVARAEN